MNELNSKTRVWDKFTKNDGGFLNEEFNKLYENDNKLKTAIGQTQRKEYEYISQDTWPVEHNFGYFPIVSVIVDNEVVWTDVFYLDTNRLEVRFSKPQTGKVILR